MTYGCSAEHNLKGQHNHHQPDHIASFCDSARLLPYGRASVSVPGQKRSVSGAEGCAAYGVGIVWNVCHGVGLRLSKAHHELVSCRSEDKG